MDVQSQSLAHIHEVHAACACEARLVALFTNDDDFFPILARCTHILDSVLPSSTTRSFFDTFKDASGAVREFFSRDLPMVADVALRRKTLREHVKPVKLFLHKLAQFLAEAVASDVPNAIVLLYLIWDGPGAPAFFDTQKLGASTPQIHSFGSVPFYSNHGKPCTAYSQGKVIYFWPDEEEIHLGGEKAIGHQLSFFDQQDKLWKGCTVVHYDVQNDSHAVDVEYVPPDATEDTKVRYFAQLRLRDVEHYWTDSSYSKTVASQSIRSQQLTFTNSDIGCIVRIWWSRYQKYFYGCVTGYNPTTRQHTITYEDADVRLYDMSQKEYEVLNLANDPALTGASNAAHRAAIAAKLVKAGAPATVVAIAEDSKSQDLIPRPHAATGFSTSEHLINVMNVFTTCNGFVNIFERLADPTKAPPSADFLLYYLRLLSQLRNRARQDVFTDLVWEAKECIPSALLRFGDHQLKHFTKEQLSELMSLLQELVTIAASVKVPIQESLDRLALQLALNMLQCSQLQKRFLGLTHVRTVIEQSFPRVMSFARRRPVIANVRAQKGIASTSATIAGGPSAAYMRPTRPTTLNANYVEDWLLENRVVDIMFGESMHTELVSRCDVILMFLALRGGLLPRHLSLIWKSCLGSHEAVSRVVHPLLLDLIPVLSPTLRTALFAEICALPFGRYTAQTLHLVKNFTVRALQAYKKEAAASTPPDGAVHPTLKEVALDPPVVSPEEPHPGGGAGVNGQQIAGSVTRKGQVVNSVQRQWFGFGLLWQFIQDPVSTSQEVGAQSSYVSSDIVDIAIDLLVELLAEPDFKDEREALVQRCIDNLSRHRSVPASLSLLRKALAAIPSGNRAWFGSRKAFNMAMAVENLQRSNDLLDLFFADLQFYHETFTLAVFGKPVQVLMDNNTSNGQNEPLPVTTTVAQNLAPNPNSSGLRPTRSTQDLSSLNERRIRIQGGSSRYPHLKQVSERLEFLSFVLGNSSLTLNEQHTVCLWQCFVSNAPSADTAKLVLTWFDKMVTAEDRGLRAMLHSVKYSIELSPASLQLLSEDPGVSQFLQDKDKGEFKVFADGVLGSFFDSTVVPYVGSYPSVSAAKVFMKLFLHVNLINKSIRTDSEGVWTRQGEPAGLNALWALAADSEDDQVSEAATVLLIEMYHRISSKLKTQADTIRGYFIRRCLSSLGANIQYLKGSVDRSQLTGLQIIVEGSENEKIEIHQPVNYASIPPSGPFTNLLSKNESGVVDIGLSADLTSRRVARYVRLLQRFINRFGQDPQQWVLVQVRVSRDGPIMTELRVRLSDTIGQLRKLVAEHFNESVQAVVILKHGSSRIGFASQDPLSNDEQTLRQAKFTLRTQIIARKREKTPPPNLKKPPSGVSSSGSQQDLSGSRPLQDLIQPEDLRKGFREALDILTWLAPPQGDGTGQDSSNETPADCNGMEGSLQTLQCFPSPPLIHKSDMVLVSQDDTSKPFSGGKEEELDIEFRRLVEFVGPYLMSRPDHFDQLFSMLDGYLSTEIQCDAGFDVSAAVWDVLQRFPTHAILLRQLRELNVVDVGHFRQLIDPNSLYKMLYSLQIVDAFISSPSAGIVPGLSSVSFGLDTLTPGISPSNERATRKWASNFLFLGGVEHLSSALQIQIRSLPEFLPSDSSGAGGAAQNGTTDEEATGDGVSRVEAYVLSMTLLSRVLHAFLLLDPTYSKWQLGVRQPRSEPQFQPQAQPVGLTGAAGVIFSSIDLKCIVNEGMDCLLRLIKSRAKISERVMGAFCEHYMMLVMGCVMASDFGQEILASYGRFHTFLKVLCLRHPFKTVRVGVCRRIFTSVACVHLKDTTPSAHARRQLCAYILNSLLVACHPEFFSDRGIPHVSSSVSIPDEMPGYDEEHTEFQSPVKSISSLQDHPTAEQAYSLIGMIFAIQSFPELSLRAPPGVTIWKPPVQHGNPDWTCHFRPTLGFSYMDMCKLFTQLFMCHKPTESFHSPLPDGTLVGILRVCLVLVHGNTEAQSYVCTQTPNPPRRTLLEMLYFDCLFPERNKKISNAEGALMLVDKEVQGAICKTTAARFLVYALMYELCANNRDNFEALVDVMLNWAHRNGNFSGLAYDSVTSSPIQFNGNLRKHWDYDPTALLKEQGEHVGLVNQGATCYMNSLIQQLYHTLPFSSRLLAVTDSSDELHDSVLFQLQVMFGYLGLSQKRFYDTLPFCRTFRDYDGQPIALHDQKDANEFCSMLFEKLETSDPTVAKIIKDTFVGTLSWVVKSTQSNYKSERLEPFYMITAEVKNKKSLEESLDLFISPEIMTGDNKVMDSDLNKKVDAERSCTIRDLPNTLIIHLKRFEFNIETLTRTKVNDYCSFPMELDMRPYTEEGRRIRASTIDSGANEESDSGPLEEEDEKVDDEVEPISVLRELNPQQDDEGEEISNSDPDPSPIPGDTRDDSYYKYTLTGIVAHTGTADSGHYYSFIRKINSSQNTIANPTQHMDYKWYEFNDRTCVPFSEELIPKECFGGSDTIHTHTGATVQRDRLNNAYMLFYTRMGTEGNESSNEEPLAETQSDARVIPVRNPSPNPIASLLEADADVDVNNNDAIQEDAPTSLQSLDDNPFSLQGTTRGDFGSNVSQQVLKAVWSENFEFLTDLNLFERTHTRLVWNIMTAPCIFSSDEALTDTTQTINPVAPINLSPTPVHARVCVLALQFVCEVLTHARAQSCIPIWFERIEQMVVQDRTYVCAKAVLSELGRTRAPTPPTTPILHAVSVPNYNVSANLTTTHVSTDSTPQQHPHPWLVEMVIGCPHISTVEAFVKLVKVCVTQLHQCQEQDFENLRLRSGKEVEGSSTDAHPSQEFTRMVGALLLTVEEYKNTNARSISRPGPNFQVGLKLASECLNSFTLLGPLERREMLRCGALWRCACVCVALREVEGLGPQLLECPGLVECVCTLVRSARVCPSSHYDTPSPQRQPADRPTPTLTLTPEDPNLYADMPCSPYMVDMTLQGHMIAPLLSHSDLSAFLSRPFLEDGAMVVSGAMTIALRHVLQGLGLGRLTISAFKVLVDRLVECTNVKGSTVTSHRSYVKVLSELLLLPLLHNPNPHPSPEGGVDMDGSALLEQVLLSLVQRSERLAARLNKGDAEFIYSICKVVVRVGLYSTPGNDVTRKVMPRVRAVRSAQRGPRPSSPGTGTGTGIGSGAGSGLGMGMGLGLGAGAHPGYG